MSDIQDILTELGAFRRKPESVGIQLRVNLAEIVLRHLRLRGWSQRDLARRTGYKEPFLSRVLHSNANCTLETAGRLLFALDVHARIEEVPSAEAWWRSVDRSTDMLEIQWQKWSNNDEISIKKQEDAQEEITIRDSHS